MKISVKTRLGYYNPDEFYDLIDIFNAFPISELIVHPRIRTDLYKGEPSREFYAYALEHSRNPLVYNGTIYHEYQKIMSPDINVLFKMRELWTYWQVLFDGRERDIKKLLKAKKYAEYESIAYSILP